MGSDSLFGSDFLEKVVEWSNLPFHSGKLFCSLKKDCEDEIGYVSVGKDVIEYSRVLAGKIMTPESNAAHLERLNSIIRLPERPHSSKVFSSTETALDRVNKRISLRKRLERIQEKEFEEGPARLEDAKDPLERCMFLQDQAVADFCAQMAKFPNRIRGSKQDDGVTTLDYSRMPLKKTTLEAIDSVTLGPIPLLGDQEGLTFKFKYFSQREMRFYF